ncbi:Replication initiation and membrane attachment [Clostridium formicaceticum]|uniref:Replication initiation and membrane attachment n=2 Tax=Clostridium formicaceticum TaxID=1497 RepID=A0AAC9RLK3_9CLOT|nr:hypothetical protein BJL90_13545 [Clostridium formicaceticum]ARE87248.1 Replication initiation and membrane attachment [Clostridium formicaceticum]
MKEAYYFSHDSNARKENNIIYEEEEKKLVPNEDKKGLVDDNFKRIVHAFNQNIHPISPMEAEKLSGWLNQMSADVIIKAIEEAVDYNARSMKQINTVLKDWYSKGLDTLDAVEAHIRDRADKNKNRGDYSSGSSNGKNGKTIEFDKAKFLYQGGSG